MTGPTSNQPRPTRVDSRSGKFSKSRIANFRRIIDALRVREMNRSDLADMINVSLQNASRYFSDLCKRGITEHVPSTDGHRVGNRVSHRLTSNAQHIADFLAGLEELGPSAQLGRTSRADVDPSRHFHLIHRDSLICAPIGEARPDPLALHPSFFRPPTVDGEPLVRCMPVIPPKPAGFPAPAAYRFEIGGQP